MAGKVPPKKIIETIREATGATDEDIKMVLAECNNDVNEATARLIDNPFATVVSKKDRRKEREEQNKKERAAESKRQTATSQRGGRGGRGGRGRPNGQPRKPASDGQAAKKPVAQPKVTPQTAEKASVDTVATEVPVAAPQMARTGRTMADLFKPKPVPEPAKAPAPRQVKQPQTTQAPQVNQPSQQTKVSQQQVANAWAKNVAEEPARPQAPSAPPPTGLATSLMSALGAGKQAAQSSLPTQQTRPSAGQGQISESEERRQPGSTSAEGVGLDLQFGNFGLGATNDFGSGFGATFDSQQNQPAAPTQASTRYNESASSGQDKTFSSFQQTETAARPQAESQQQMQGAYGYSGYQQAAAYWQPQQPARQAPPQEQQQEHQAKPKTEPQMQQQQQQHQQAQYQGYAGPNMGAMGHQYPGYGQYAGYGNYYQYYQQAPYPYYAPQQAPQYAAPPPAPAAGQAPRAAGNNFGAMYEQQEPAYQQPPPSVNYQGQPAYSYGGQYTR